MTKQQLWQGAAYLLLLGSLGACDRTPAGSTEGGPVASGSGAPTTPDRLAPGELEIGKDVVFGLPLPKKMVVTGRFGKATRASGGVRPEELSNYIRQHVAVQHVEIAAARTVFPLARIKGGDPDKVYRIEVIPAGRSSRLTIKDVTPPPKSKEPISDEERWRRAGLTVDGKLLDPKNLE